MLVLGIESSCDDTACGVVGPAGVLSDVVHSQAIHARYGGVVPEVASRAHAEKIVVTARAALERAGIERPDAVAATAGPGLVGAVLVGLCFGKGLAAGWGLPFVGVNHLEGHLLSPLLEPTAPEFPFLALVVSGGHTTLYAAKGVGDYAVVAETVDDAAGEAFDKVARLLGLGYPGGPAIEALAKDGDRRAVALPRPRAPRPLDMSFSGLKTAVRGAIDTARPEDVAASFQEAVCDVLCDRLVRAVAATGIDRVALAGGVAANERLRERVQALGLAVTLPPRARCTDNGAMIAAAGRLRLLRGGPSPFDVTARARWTPGQ
jgi:N6-L-threonylcarbamoyladenine synthase